MLDSDLRLKYKEFFLSPELLARKVEKCISDPCQCIGIPGFGLVGLEALTKSFIRDPQLHASTADAIRFIVEEGFDEKLFTNLLERGFWLESSEVQPNMRPRSTFRSICRLSSKAISQLYPEQVLQCGVNYCSKFLSQVVDPEMSLGDVRTAGKLLLLIAQIDRVEAYYYLRDYLFYPDIRIAMRACKAALHWTGILVRDDVFKFLETAPALVREEFTIFDPMADRIRSLTLTAC